MARKPLDEVATLSYPPQVMGTLIGATEAATVLGRSVRMVQRLAKEGKLPIAQKMPGQTGAYLFDRDTVEASKGVVQ